jgi:SOS response regulatory protein OraA/RecX
VDEIYHYALKLLQRRDYSEKQLREKLASKVGAVPAEVFSLLRTKRFLDDRRYADNFVARHADSAPEHVKNLLEMAGIGRETIDAAVSAVIWPSLRDVLKAKMLDWRLHAPLQRRDAARLFRALSRLGYTEDEIREELEQFHEQ